jgi:hypothetical protein
MGVKMTKRKDPKDYQKVGRPTVMTDEVVSKLEQAWSMGCSDLEACLFADISKQTLYDYQAKYPEFVDRKERLKESLVLKARTVIANSLNNKDENTAKWYLERKKKDEFSTKVENETEIKGLEVALVQWK